MADKVMQYVGARYVPKFADPVEWQSNTSYEALTIVTYNNSSYTSKIPVPATVGNPADNGTYWVVTGNYNSQVEQYRQETEEVKNSQSTLNSKIEQEISDRTALIYNNNGKADVPLGLSVEGKLSANDGAEISGMLKYGNIGSYKDHSSVAFEDNSGSSFHVPTVEGKDDKTLLLVGDSWTNTGTYAEGTTLAKTFERFYSKVYNYGINGAKTAQIATMCKQAYDDGIRPDEIIAICGTNDVFWGDSKPTGLTEAFDSVNSYYKYVPKYYIPNNSKTANKGHSSWYNTIIAGATEGGWNAIGESLYTLINLLDYYAGNDEYGVQHLSEQGQYLFATYVHGLLRNGINGVGGYVGLDASDCIIKKDGTDATGNVFMTFNKGFNGIGILGLHVEFAEAYTGKVSIYRNVSSRTSGVPLWYCCDSHVGQLSTDETVFVNFGDNELCMPFKNATYGRVFVPVPFPFI